MQTAAARSRLAGTGFGGGALVALFAYTVNGDPISGAWAQQRAIRYAEQRFPGQTFTAPKGSWYSYYFNYSVEVQSDQSPDTHFTVETRKWLWLDDYGTTDAVTNGVTARQRMEQALTDKAQRMFDALSDGRIWTAPSKWNSA